MRVLTLDEMERVAGGSGKPKATAKSGHKSRSHSGHSASRAASNASSCSGSSSSGGTCAPPPLLL